LQIIKTRNGEVMDQENNFFNLVCNFIDEQEILNQPCRESLDTTLIELNLDSLELVDLSLQLEKKFSKRIDFDKIDSNTTLNSLIKCLL
jgi:acyl carrier protein